MKIGARIAILGGISVALGLFSCAKEYQNRECDTPSRVECDHDTSMVNVRVVNYTGYPVCELKVLYYTDVAQEYNYGTLKNGDSTCYVKMNYSLAFPHITFNLGAGQFRILDSLKKVDLPYHNMKVTSKGYYTLYLQIPMPLDSERVSSVIYPSPAP